MTARSHFYLFGCSDAEMNDELWSKEKFSIDFIPESIEGGIDVTVYVPLVIGKVSIQYNFIIK